MTEEQLARLRSWAAGLAESGAGEREAAGRTIQALADRCEQLRRGDRPYWDRIELFEAKGLARQLSTGDGPAARRSAARAITLLIEEHERLCPPPPELAPAWPDANGGNGQNGGNGRNGGHHGNGNGNGNGAHGTGLELAEPESPLPPRATRRMPPREDRGPQRPLVRDSERGVGTTLGELRPSGSAVRRVAYWVIGAAIVVATFVYAPRLAAPELDVVGPTSDLIGMRDADVLAFSVTSPAVENARWSLDGREVSGEMLEENVERRGATSTFKAVALEEGEHRVSVEVAGAIPGATAKHEWAFTVDLTPPTVELATESGRADWGKPVTIAGTVGEESSVEVAGRAAEIEDGRFSVRFEEAPRGTILVRATDTAGNVTEHEASLNIIPRRPATPIRAVHVTFWAWRHHRAEILDYVDSGKVTVIQLDLKDESGIVGFDAGVPLGEKIGAEQDVINLEKAVRILHERGVRVVGRLVAFRDPIHAPWAWKAGRKNQVIQTPSGEPYAGYGGFTNFANPAVRQYNIDIARAAAAAGVDEILFDYIRRPDGPIESMRFPGLEGRADRAIADFLRETREQLPERVFIGASVFGVAATRPEDVAQNIPMMARELDYIAPMVYPSHWTPGEYGVENPNAQPYDIVLASLEDFQKQMHGTGARIVPWLQDFTMGYPYGPREVRAQIDAAAKLGIDEWILWNPTVKYTEEALDTQERPPRIETVTDDLPPADG